MDVLTDKVTEMRCTNCQHAILVAAFPSFSEVKCPKCGSVQTVPARLNGFLLVSLLGKGGMGAVYQGQDERLNRPVAVKVLLRSLSEDPKFIETFKREAQAVAALNHPNIVQIYAFGEEKGQQYMVMELLSGGRLDKMIAGGRPVDETTVVRIAIDIAEGLKAANDIGLLHGDIKPENILLDSSKVAKIVDFGLASFKDKAAATDGIWGTPYYIAPEKVRRQRVDARSDIYSLGATLFHALTGKPPFEGNTPLDVVRARLIKPAPALTDVMPGANRDMGSILARMLQADPLLRHPTYSSLIGDLCRVLDTLGPQTKIVGTSTRRTSKIVVTKGKSTTGVDIPPQKSSLSTGNIPAPKEVLAVSPSDALKSYKTIYLHAAGGASKKKGSRAIRIAVIASVLVLAAAGIVIGIGMKMKQALDRKAALAALEDARSLVLTTFLSINSATTNSVARAREARALWPPVTNMLASAEAMIASSEAVKQAAESLPKSGDLYEKASNAVFGALAKGVELTNLFQQARMRKESALTVADKAQTVQAIHLELVSMASNAHALATAVEQGLADARKAKDEADQFQKKLLDIKVAADLEAARIAAQKAEEERKGKEEAEKKRLEEEQKERAGQEAAKVKGAYEANAAAIKENRHKEALEEIQKATGTLKTEEGKAALAVITERVTLLMELKGFFIKQINEEPYRWGWLSPAGSALDILGATETEIKLTGRSVPWSQASAAQMVKFIKHYVTPERAKKAELGRLYLAAAAYCYENGGMKMAADYASKAVETDESLKDTVKKIMPGLPAAEATAP